MKIGTGAVNALQAQKYNQNLVLKRDVGQAQQRNVSTFGRQSRRATEERCEPDSRGNLGAPAWRHPSSPAEQSAASLEQPEAAVQSPARSTLRRATGNPFPEQSE